MESNEIIRKQMLEVVNNQLKANDPPETKKTLKRLMLLKYTELEAKQLIAQCVLVEIFDALKNKKPYNQERYISNLNNLPEPPF
ncbi:hypothetical protein DMA11_12175 [Marinilabiliaceae bacterium JC017]|nr:hypothetical protein DMA11_12175 [Marinilabiliaceae bacterium JC017]